MNAATATLMQDIIRRESRSLLLYVGDAFPWTTAGHAPDLATLRQLVRQESAALHALGKFLLRRRVTPPFFGSYPASFTSCNFVDLAYLLPRLKAAAEKSIAETSADRTRLTDPEARQQVEAYLVVKQSTLAGLTSLAASRSQPARA